MAASDTALAMAERMEPAFSSKRRPSCSKFSFSAFFPANTAVVVVAVLVLVVVLAAVTVLVAAVPYDATAVLTLVLPVVGGGVVATAPGGNSAFDKEVRMS